MSAQMAGHEIPPRPEVAPPPRWDFPQPREQTHDGLRTAIFHAPGQYVASVRVVLPAPLSSEPRDVEGVGTILTRVLDEGTQSRSAEEMAEVLERGGISVSASVGERGLIIALDVPVHRLAPALALLRELLLEPALGQIEVDRQVRSRLVDIAQERANPGMRAALEFAATHYARDVRASRPIAGSPDTVESITADAVRDYHERILTRRGCGIVVAGDLSGVDTDALLMSTFDGWDSQREAVQPQVTRRAPDAARIVIVDRPGSVQSEFYLGTPGPDRRVPGGWAPFPVASYLVGGAPHARLDAVLREERGYTYGMRASARPRVDGGLFLVSGSVRADATAPALELTFDILSRAREGFGPQETTAGVDFLSRTAPGRFATADALADEAAARLLDGLGTVHTAEVLEHTAQLNATEVSRAYEEHIGQDWTSVLVGDAEAIADQVRSLGRGTVDVVDDVPPQRTR